MKRIRKFIHTAAEFWTVFGFISFLTLGGTAYIGFLYGREYPKNLVVKGVSNIGNDPKVAADFSAFWQEWKLLKDEHIKGGELKEQSMIYGAMEGLAKSLDDPHTIFFPPVESKKFEEDVRGNFGGIGAEIGIKNDQLVIIAPLKDSPAEKAGLRAGDKIIKVNDKFSLDMKVGDAVTLIRGEIGTKVTLNILRNGWEKPKDFVITRGEIIVPTIDYKMLEGSIAYVRLKSFNENAPGAFYDAMKELLGKGINGVILDLRDDPGGFLEVAVDIAGWFMEPGSTVAIQEFRDQSQNRIFRTSGRALLKPVPTVVLVNQGSASASEILAGALRDNLGVKLVGEKTFGKGTVQELRRLLDGSSLKITISHWKLPKGDLIDKVGIVPDYEVKLTDEDIKAEKDTQLLKAQEVIKGLIEKVDLKTAAEN